MGALPLPQTLRVCIPPTQEPPWPTPELPRPTPELPRVHSCISYLRGCGSHEGTIPFEAKSHGEFDKCGIQEGLRGSGTVVDRLGWSGNEPSQQLGEG